MAAASLFERIAEEVKKALLDADIPGIEDQVERAREDAGTFEDGDYIAVRTDSTSQRTHSDALDDHELLLDVCINVRASEASKGVWETQADEYAVLAHTIVMKHDYNAAGIRLARVRLTDQDWMAEAGDSSPGRRTLKYAFRFLTLADDITLQP